MTQHEGSSRAIQTQRPNGRRDAKILRQAGYALGSSLDNSITVHEDKILNPGGLRYEDEFVRHKILDAIGDLYLVGHPLLASYEAHKSGHGLNNLLLLELSSRMIETRGLPLVASKYPSSHGIQRDVFAARDVA